MIVFMLINIFTNITRDQYGILEQTTHTYLINSQYKVNDGKNESNLKVYLSEDSLKDTTRHISNRVSDDAICGWRSWKYGREVF